MNRRESKRDAAFWQTPNGWSRVNENHFRHRSYVRQAMTKRAERDVRLEAFVDLMQQMLWGWRNSTPGLVSREGAIVWTYGRIASDFERDDSRRSAWGTQ
jgi:hypothetical protein